MCGISGIIDKRNRPVEAAAIERMTDLVAHRGPDGFGYYYGDNFALGHRRLAILDLTQAGKQPMAFAEKYVVVYNGEIYNYVELKEELIRKGYCFSTRTDTEVLLAAYDKWGADCVAHFNGMWAFALYDRERNLLFCSRDRFGVKPFHYAEIDGRFLFGSEIKQIIEFFPHRRANLQVLLNYLILGFEDYNQETFFANVFKLLPGHSLFYDLRSHRYEIRRYYSVQAEPRFAELSESEAVALYRAELERSATVRLRSDVKVGTCLSGGLDSSAIASLAAERYHQTADARFSAITAQSIDEVNDESHFAELVARRAHLDWNVIAPNQADFLHALEQVIYAQEEPFGSPSIAFQFFVMQKARELDCPVLLDGQGGDETLLGYERYYPTYLHSLPIYRWAKAFTNSSKNSKLSKGQLLSYVLYFSNPSVRRKWLQWKNDFIKDNVRELVDWHLLASVGESYKSVFGMQKAELETIQLPHLLRYEDRNSMHFSIEARLPYLDYKLVELALSLSPHLKIKEGWTKYILRKAIEDRLPPAVVWRKHKRGFEPPIGVWLSNRAELGRKVKESTLIAKISSPDLLGKALKAMDLRSLWKLYNIARWEEAYGVTS